MNIDAVSVEATAAANSSQSSVTFSQLSSQVCDISFVWLTFSIVMPCIKGCSVLLYDTWIEAALHVIHRLWHKIQAQFLVAIKIVQQSVSFVHPVSKRSVGWVCVHSNT